MFPFFYYDIHDSCMSDKCYIYFVSFLFPGFLGWAAYTSSLLHILWFVSGNIVSSQQTE